MVNYFEPILSEEQLAAYLDGMLSSEESTMVEKIIASDPEMEEIQEAIDSIDSTYIIETGEDIPIECLADDFILPDMDEYNHSDDVLYHPDDSSEGLCEDTDDYQNDHDGLDCQDDVSGLEHEDVFIDNNFDDISF